MLSTVFDYHNLINYQKQVFPSFKLRSHQAGPMSCLSLYSSGLHIQFMSLYTAQGCPASGVSEGCEG